jgi:cell division protein FtsZ
MSNFKVELPKERSSIIKVIGVGGGGSNAVNHMYRQGIIGVDFFVCNTDSQALDRSPVPNKIQLGTSLTEGLGAGSNPDVGKKAALESIEEIIDLLGVNTKMIFVTAGMGGGTGTGAAPIIAKTAKEMGILTVGIVTTPFSFEGPRRTGQAATGVSEMREAVDALLVISNDKIKEMYSNFLFTKAFAQADEVLTIAAKGIAEIITTSGDGNVDFQDVRTAMTDSGKAILGSGIADGDERAMQASQMAINSPLLDNTQIEGAGWLLINISWGKEEPTMEEISTVMDFFQQKAGQNANLKFGWCSNEKLEDKLSVTIIATGFGDKENTPKEENNAVRLPLIEEPKAEETSTTPSVENTEDTPKAETEKEIVFTKNNTPAESNDEIVFQPQSHEQPKTIAESDFFSHTPIKEEQEDTEAVRVELRDAEIDAEEEKERIRKQKERMVYLRNLTDKAKNPEGAMDMEKEPAYVRKGAQLDDVPHSSESQVSKFSLFENKENVQNNTEIKTNNSFLHDNVD